MGHLIVNLVNIYLLVHEKSYTQESGLTNGLTDWRTDIDIPICLHILAIRGIQIQILHELYTSQKF